MASIASIELKLEIDQYKPYDDRQTASYSEYILQKLEVPDGTANGAVSMGGVTTGELLYITSDQVVTFKLSGGSDSRTVKANKLSLFLGDSFTSLTVSNASGELATMTVLIAG